MSKTNYLVVSSGAPADFVAKCSAAVAAGFAPAGGPFFRSDFGPPGTTFNQAFWRAPQLALVSGETKKGRAK